MNTRGIHLLFMLLFLIYICIYIYIFSSQRVVLFFLAHLNVVLVARCGRRRFHFVHNLW